MGFIFGRAAPDEPECPGVRVVNGQLKPCRGATHKESVAEIPPEDTRCVVTLVHGTFAKHAPWMRDDSKLCRKLKTLPGTALRRFCWSGGNTHTARLQAGDELAFCLRDVKKQFPDSARHFVIAHSHGGNVALYAMNSAAGDDRGESVGDDIAGVITLATPFLMVRKRSLPKFVFPSVGLLMLIVAVVSLFAVLSKPPAFLRSPVGGTVSGDIQWVFDLHSDASKLDFQWTKNKGDAKSWKEATAVGNSPLKNPLIDVKADQKLTFVWDSAKDLGDQNVGEAVDLRVLVNGKRPSDTISTRVQNSEGSESSYEAPSERKPPSWKNVIVVTVLFLVWLILTVVSALVYRGKKFKLRKFFQLLREQRTDKEQPNLDEELKSLKPTSIDGDKVLVMRPLGDEANMGLVVSQFLSWAQNRILGFVQDLRNGFLGWPDSECEESDAGHASKAAAGKRSLPVGCFTAFLKLAVLLFLLFNLFGTDTVEGYAIDKAGSWLFPEGAHWSRFLLLVPLLLFVGLLGFFVVLGLVSLIGLLGLVLAAFPAFGSDAMFLNHFATTTAEPAPVGTKPAHIFHAEPKGGAAAPGLAHSGIYTNDDAIEAIVGWIKNRL